ncbi:MAG TPA: 16S rRNA (uracil(1498)-N(3))-methyltransferase [Methylophilaceae bacterium]|nr:16S rRNA (uracil(1498)-N(3))-methyltransferase [Methylophilaceae bacterium]
MPNPRFYHPEKLAPGATITLTPNAAVHASRALRLQVGDQALLFNGDGNDYLCELIVVKKTEVVAKIKAVEHVDSESPLKISLAQAISSGDRMDYTIQKAVELGVGAIQPIASQRSVVKLTGERAEKRREHWQNVVISACEQSGRAVLPTVAAPLSLADWLARPSSADLRITLSPTAEHCLHELPPPQGEICLLIGAEGGLTEHEIALAASQGFVPVRLGNRILRTETAPIAAISAMQTLWGDFNR